MAEVEANALLRVRGGCGFLPGLKPEVSAEIWMNLELDEERQTRIADWMREGMDMGLPAPFALSDAVSLELAMYGTPGGVDKPVGIFGAVK